MLSLVLKTHTLVCTQIPRKDTQELGTVGASGEKRGDHETGVGTREVCFSVCSFELCCCASSTSSGINMSVDKYNVKFPDEDILTSELYMTDHSS